MRWLLAAVIGVAGCRQVLGIEDLTVGDGAGSTDGAGRDDGGGGGADASMCLGPPQTVCGGIANLVDDFEDGVTGSQWVSYRPTGGMAGEDGDLVLDPGNLPPGSAYYSSRWVYDFTGAVVSVEVPEVQTGGDAVTELGIDLPGANVHMRHQAGMLSFGTVVSGVPSDGAPMPYDPLAHRFWRIRHTGANAAFDTAPDGCDWATLGVLPFGASEDLLQFATLRLEARHSEAPGAGVSRFDDLDVGAPGLPWCLASSFADNFGEYSVLPPAPRWRELPNGCSNRSIAAGTISLSAATNGSCGYETARRFTLDEGSIAIGVSTITAGAQAQFLALGDNGRSVQIQVRPDGFHMMDCDTSNCGEIGSTAANPSSTPTTVSFESAPAGRVQAWVLLGGAWTSLGQTTAPGNPVAFSFKVVSSGSGAAIDAAFSSFNGTMHP